MGRTSVACFAIVLSGCMGASPWAESERGWRVERERYVATVGASGLDVGAPDGDPIHVSVASVSLAGTQLDGDASDTRGTALVRALSQGVEELVVPADDGVEISWRVGARPDSAGDLVVRLQIDGARASTEDERGWHFVVGDRGLRVAPATWIDDDGVRTRVDARVESDTLSLVVPADVIARSSFPAVLDPVLGPELPVDPPATSVLGTFSPHDPSIAFDGTNYMIAWLETHTFPTSTYSNDITVARVRASDGVLLDPGGIVVARTPSAAFAGDPDIAFDGTRFLAVWDASTDIVGARIAVDGTVLDTTPLVLSNATGYQLNAAVACVTGSCLAVWDDQRSTSRPETIGTRIDTATGAVRDPLGLVLATDTNEPDVATDGTNYFVAWAVGGFARATRIRASDGFPIGSVITVATDGIYEYDETAVAYAAGEYVVTWRTTSMPSAPYAARVRASDGVVLDATPALLSSSTKSETGLAACPVGNDFLLSWSVDIGTTIPDNDVRGTVMRSSDGVLAPAAGLTLTGGFWDQTQPALAAGPPGQLLLAYVDNTNSVARIAARRIDATTLTAIDTTPILVSVIANEERSPALASDGTSFLAVWTDSRGPRARIYGARIAPDGTAIDASAFAISDGVGTAIAPAVAFGSGQYYVVWDDARTSGSDLYGARVSPSGALIDATSRQVYSAPGTQTLPSIAFDGARFVLTWDDSRNSPQFVLLDPSDGSVVNPLGSLLSSSTGRRAAVACSSALCLATWLNGTQGQAARIDHGTVLDATPLALGPINGTLLRPGADPGGFLVVYETAGGSGAILNGRRVPLTGPLGGTSTLRSGTDASFAIVNDAAGYAVAWVDAGHVGVVRAHTDGSVTGTYSANTPGTTTQAVTVIASTSAGTSLMAYDWADYYTRTFGGWRVRVRSVTPAADGAVCTSASDCAHGNCVDGVCCATPCGGGTNDCQACSVAAGAGVDGVCGVIVAPAHVCRASATACDLAEICDGLSTECPSDVLAPAATVCRAPTDLCDAPEVCNGLTNACPADAISPAGTVCRDASDACDAVETCTGSSRACPADGVRPGGTACRAAADVCDAAEACDGVSVACPMDMVQPAGSACRPIAGPCDVAESCDGASVLCPADVFVTSALVCRASASTCDAPEACSGASAQCPADGHVPDGTSCADTLSCNGSETCQAGSCGSGTPLSCDDGDPCTSDHCAEPAGCAHDPIASCGSDASATRDAGVDAGVDASRTPDASADGSVTGIDAGGATAPSSGCGCRAQAAGRSRSAFAWVLLVLALIARRRRQPSTGA